MRKRGPIVAILAKKRASEEPDSDYSSREPVEKGGGGDMFSDAAEMAYEAMESGDKAAFVSYLRDAVEALKYEE